jgi:hypothetical protein
MSADDRRRTVDGKRDLAANTDGLLVPRAHATADRIDHKRLHPLDGRWVEVFIAKPEGIVSEPFGKRTIVGGPIFSTRYLGSKRKRGCAGAEMKKPTTGNCHCIAVLLLIHFWIDVKRQ